MAGFFSQENSFWKPFNFIADVAILSGAWLLSSLPIVTMGAATTAIYDCTVRCVRSGEQDMVSRYIHTFRREFLPALLSTLLWGGVMGLGYGGARLYGNSVAVNQLSTVVTVGILFLTVMIAGIFSWVLPLLSRFTFRFSDLTITALKLALAHPVRTALLGVGTVLTAYACVRFVVPVVFLPALLMLYWSFLLEPVFKKYMPQEEE